MSSNVLHVIKPSQSRSLIDELSDIWRNRELLLMFARRDVAVRYKQAIIGVAWVVLQPLFMTAIFTLIFSVMARIPSDGIPYPVFVFSGLLIWQYFNRTVLEGSNSFIENYAIITKIYFPRLLIPLGVPVAAAIDFLLSIAVLFLLMLFFEVPVTWTFLLIPLFMVLAGLLGYTISLILAPVNAIYRDVGIALPFVMQILMFMSPVFYPVSFVPEKFQFLYMLNPVATIVESMRWAVLGGDAPSIWSYVVLFIVLSFLLVVGLKVFRSLETTLVDRI